MRPPCRSAHCPARRIAAGLVERCPGQSHSWVGPGFTAGVGRSNPAGHAVTAAPAWAPTAGQSVAGPRSQPARGSKHHPQTRGRSPPAAAPVRSRAVGCRESRDGGWGHGFATPPYHRFANGPATQSLSAWRLRAGRRPTTSAPLGRTARRRVPGPLAVWLAAAPPPPAHVADGGPRHFAAMSTRSSVRWQLVWHARWPAGAPWMGLRPSSPELLLVQLLVAVAVLALQHPERAADGQAAGPICGSAVGIACRSARYRSGRRSGAPAPAAVMPGLALAPGRRRGGRAMVQGGRRDRAAPAGRPRTYVVPVGTDRLTSTARRFRMLRVDHHGHNARLGVGDGS